MERRLHTRHRARTTVYVIMSGRKSRICKAKNLSANGVFVETENLGLRKGQQVQLAFAINLGLITKIHRRTAIVAHVTRGGTGLMMEQFGGRYPWDQLRICAPQIPRRYPQGARPRLRGAHKNGE